MALWRLTEACGLRASLTRGQHKAAAEAVKARPAQPLALQHVEALDMSRDRTRTPGQRPPGFDRLVILIAPCREASYSLHCTCGGALQPGIEARRLLWADQAREILREGDGFGDDGLLCPQRGELLCLGLGTLGLAPQYQPGSPARGQRLARRLGNHW